MEHLYSLLEKLNTQKNVDSIKQSGLKEFSIKFRNPILVKNVLLLDTSGRKNKTNFKQSKNYIKIDISDCDCGIYLLKIFSETGMECYKITKN